MMRLLAVFAVLTGLAVGMAFPGLVSSNETGYELAVALTPPTLSPGSTSTLNCGWHVACESPWDSTNDAGHGLDWEDGSGYGNDWFFRGYFYVENTSRTAFHMYPIEVASGAGVCDKMTVWIAEKHSGALMAIPIFLHVNITDDDDFEWTGSQWTTWHSKKIGETINENDLSCSSGSHVHEAHSPWLAGTVETDENRADYVVSSTCHTAGTCGPYENDDIDNWTRSFTWDEGAVSH